MAKKQKNYYGLYRFAIVVLLILSVVIYNFAHDYWKALMFLPLLIIILLGIKVDKIEEKEEQRKHMDIRQHYQYPKK